MSTQKGSLQWDILVEREDKDVRDEVHEEEDKPCYQSHPRRIEPHTTKKTLKNTYVCK